MCSRPERAWLCNCIDHGIFSDFKFHKIRRNREKLDEATSRGVHQKRYAKTEEKKYEQPEEPIERIAEVHIPSIYIPFLLTPFRSIDYQANKRGEPSTLSLFFAKSI